MNALSIAPDSAHLRSVATLSNTLDARPGHHPCQTHKHHPTMPLDTSTYSLALLRLDGRRWNELRRIHAQISTQAAADGSSYLEMGNTKVLCTVTGPAEGRQAGQRGGKDNEAKVEVEIGFAGFSGLERRKRKNDK
jgi:exosome complex component RRP41